MTNTASRAAAAASGLDHIVIYVPTNLDAIEAHWRKQGFAPTVRGYHNVGTMNHLVMLETDYIELLSPNESTNAPRGALLSYPWTSGLAALALRTSDADADYQRCTELGIAMDPPNDFARPVMLAGAAQDARFRVTMVRPEITPGLIIFFCQHKTPHLVWRPECMNHPNGATAIRGVRLTLRGAHRIAEVFAAIARVEPVRNEHGVVFDLGDTLFCLQEASEPAEECAEVTIALQSDKGLAPIARRLPAFPDAVVVDRPLSLAFESSSESDHVRSKS